MGSRSSSSKWEWSRSAVRGGKINFEFLVFNCGGASRNLF